MIVEDRRVDRTNVAALIPAYLEARQIADVARRVRAQLDEVLVVDDGSTDATADAARSADVQVLRHEVNQGKGAAIKTGLRELSTRRAVRYVLLLDGDGQHLPEEIPRFLEEASRSGSPLIMGSRFTDLRSMPFVRRMTNRFMSWQVSGVCGQPIPDTQCGFRMVGTELIPALLEGAGNNYDYETEMLVIASRRGCRIASVPVSTVYGEEQSKIHPVRDTIRFLRLMRRCRREAALG